MHATYYIAGIPYSAELYHHGIKGQRWGVRRYTNPDGTLTEEGKRRYGTIENYRASQNLAAAKKEMRSARSNYMVRNDPLANGGNRLGTSEELIKKYQDSKAKLESAKQRAKTASERGRKVAMRKKIMDSPIGAVGTWLASSMARNIRKKYSNIRG